VNGNRDGEGERERRAGELKLSLRREMLNNLLS